MAQAILGIPLPRFPERHLGAWYLGGGNMDLSMSQPLYTYFKMRHHAWSPKSKIKALDKRVKSRQTCKNHNVLNSHASSFLINGGQTKGPLFFGKKGLCRREKMMKSQ